uniref:Rho guanine nucleotide exchange factor 7 n=1 Tax=Trichuris muris TaxID=70415 RepID=A0A5S6QZY5_TRIMR
MSRQTAESSAVVTVQAKYNFTGRNNDELCFKKGDVIVVTQQLNEGWWEGTLNDKTGWFPSNYVSVEKPDYSPKTRITVENEVDSSSLVNVDRRLAFRNMVLRDLLENEQKHLEELVGFWEVYVKPLKDAEIVSKFEFSCLVGNISQVIQFQSDFCHDLIEEAQKASRDQRIGGKFLRSAETLKHLLAAYCKNHPTAVNVINCNREKLAQFMQSKGGNDLLLVSRLSQPFRHVETYAVALLEFERNLEENHPDRGDTQRAVAVYREIANHCSDLRKQKEMQLDLLNSIITDWEGEPLESLGDILLVIKANAKLEGVCDGDCCIILFAEYIVVLQVSPHLNGYIYKGFKSSYYIASTVTRRMVDRSRGKLSIELVSKLDDRVLLTFSVGNMDDLNRWSESLEALSSENTEEYSTLISPTTPSKYTKIETEVSPLLKARVSHMPVPGHAEFVKKIDDPLKVLSPKRYNGYCLRPLPTQKSWFGTPFVDGEIKMRKKPDQVELCYDADEIELLQVVESYCSSTSDSWKPLICSRNGRAPDVLIAEDEKIFCEEFVGDELIVQEKTLVDTVYALKDQVRILSEIVNDLSRAMHADQAAHKRTDDVLRQIVAERASTSSSLSNCAKDYSSAEAFIQQLYKES